MKDYFKYDVTSSTYLRRICDVRSGKEGRIVVARSGDEAGGMDARGEAMVVRFRGKLLKVHNVIAELMCICIPAGYVIDHEDGDPRNNEISNLRAVPSVLNSHNRRIQHNNSSGVAGVSWWTDQRGNLHSLTRWQESTGKRKSKAFSVAKYGKEEATDLAVAYRKAMIATLNLQGHGYTERHGK